MLNLTLSENEGKLLSEVLDISLNRLGDEISHTDSHDYRERLKERRELLQKLRGKLH